MDDKMKSATEPMRPAAPNKKVRWWPAVMIVLGACATIAWLRWIDEDSHQHRNINVAKSCLGAILLLLGWCLFFSRLPWRARFMVLGCFVAVVAGGGALFHIRGVTGDLLPILEWRWHREPEVPSSGESKAASIPERGTNAAEAGVAIDGWPQFLGPNRDARLSGPHLERDWTHQPPKEIWRRQVGAGWSGFAVAGGCAVTQEQRGSMEVVACYEAGSGRPIWTHSDEARYFTTIAGEGPRATPAIDGDRVYTIGATGILNCLDLQTGKTNWSRQILIENDSKAPGWGLSVSPLILEGFLVASVGGKDGKSLVAYDKRSGQFAWGGGHDGASYSSPVVFPLGGERQILIYNSGSVAGHDPVGGRLLWEYKRPSSNPNVAVPVLLPGDRVLVTSGYGVGAEALDVAKGADGKWEAKRAWKSMRLKAKFTNVVYRDGFIYGLDDGILACLDAATGEQKWKDGRYGHGQVILVGNLLLLMAEEGDVVLLEPVPQERRELGRFSAFKTKTWNPPALAGDYLFVRNDMEAACFRLPLAKRF
jgi:outer membrane protein assembly factor BamB